MPGRKQLILLPLLLIAATAFAQDPRGPLYYNQPFVDGGASKSDVVRYVAGALAAGGTLPSQASQGGKFLSTDGTTATWQTPSGNATTVNGAAVPATVTMLGTDSSGTLIQQLLPSNTLVGNMTAGTAAATTVNAVLIPSATVGGVLAANGTNSLVWSASIPAGNLMVGTGTGAPAGIGFNWQPGGSTTTAFGTAALQTCTTCTNSAALGASALANSTGNNDTAFGYQALNFNSTGIQSTAVGTQALKGISGTPITGNSNTAIGYNALTNCQGACGNNTAIGQSAGSSLTTGTANTFIGNAVCSSNCTTGGNNVVIGTNVAAVTPTTSSSNTLCIAMGNGCVISGSGGGTPATAIVTMSGPLQAGAVGSSGTTFTLGTGTGACATTSTLTGGASSGSFLCTGTAGASTIIVNLPTVTNGWTCVGSDITSGVAFTQVTPTATNACKLTGTIATTSDKVTFHAFSY